VVNDMSDNPGGGGAGDSTGLLGPMLATSQAIRERAAAEGLQPGTFGFVFDPEVARLAHEAGVGATIQCRLGAKTDDRHGVPLAVTAYVKCLTDGQFVQTSPMGRGTQVDLGKTARLVIDGIDVLVASVRTQTLDDEVFRLHGIDVTRYKLVALKSANHFRAAFEPLARAIVTADGPGLSARDVRLWPYRNLRRPLWPFDPVDRA
jgi:microcystin degradation protein MlrC